VQRTRSGIVQLLACVLLGAWAASASAQLQNPVYFDDSPRAGDTLGQIPSLTSSGNWSEAVRALQALLDEDAERLLPTPGDPDLLVSVRRRVHETLIDSPELLERYREAQRDEAQRLLDEGDAAIVERSYLLTPAGFEAALRLAQQHLESARFEAAALTLEQLDDHPDRSGASSGEAAALLSEVARYLDRPSLGARAQRWAVQAGVAIGRPAPAERPELASREARSPYLGGEEVQLTGMLRAPLHSVELMPPELFALYFRRSVRSGGRAVQATPQPWIFPTVVGDTVYVNNGFSVSAWDRFTLNQKWRAAPPAPTIEQIEDQRRFGLSTNLPASSTDKIEDTASVTVAGRVVIATTGIAASNGREADGRVHAFDARNGARLWSVAVAGLDPSLDSASVRGPAMVEGDTVIVSARKSIQSRRLSSVYLVGLELGTGELRWVRLLGSVGSLPAGSVARPSPSAVLHDGVVYRTDTIGLTAAIDATTGRPRWIRRLEGAPARSPNQLRRAWANPHPIVDGADLFVIAPNGRELLRLERETGRVLGRIAASRISSPKYLARVGGHIAAVGTSSISFVPVDGFEQGRVRDTDSLHATPPIGRAFASGDRLVVPTGGGLLVFDPEAPREPDIVELEHYGNMVGLESQLVVVDERQLHSYLVWSVASELLRERMDARADDASPAITYAELAFLAGHDGEVLGAVDRAIRVIEADPTSEPSVGARGRLIDAISSMVIASQRAWSNELVSDDRPIIEDLDQLGGLVDRLGRVVRTSNDQVFYLLALGRHRAAVGDVGSAIESYQQVLADPDLSSSDWSGAGVTVRAENETTRRLNDLLREYGPTPYQPFDAEAAVAVELLGANASPVQFEQLARRYPVSGRTPAIWSLAAEAYERIDRPLAAVRARRAALEAARFGVSIGRVVPDDELGELLGGLVDALVRAEHADEAADLLEETQDLFPGVVLTSDGRPLAVESLAAELAELISRRRALPKIGLGFGAEVQRLEGWVHLTPLTPSNAGERTDSALFVSRSRRQVALFVGGSADDELSQRWAVPFEGQREPELVRVDSGGAYIYESIGEQGRLVRLDLETGGRDWVSPVFDELFGPRLKIRERLFDALGPVEVETPLDDRVRLLDLMVVADGQTIVLIERSGRAVGLDQTTGRLLWAAVTPVSVVHDTDAAHGVLAIGGLHEERLQQGAEPVGFEPVAAAYDVRTGELLQRLDRLDGAVRWVRIASGPDMLLGLDTSVLSVSLHRGHINWTIRDAGAQMSRSAWLFGELFFVLDDAGELWLGELDSGRLSDKPLRTDRRLLVSSPVRVTRFENRIAFRSARGFVLFDAEGRRVGIDALDGFEAFVPPAPGVPHFVTIDKIGDQHGLHETAFSMFVMSSDSAKRSRPPVRVLLDSVPEELSLLDGRVLIKSGGSTAVLRAPID
jgi:outer membrane protein assembly factor BamB